MWCTQCHTAFDWKTGGVIKDRIHNPHYYEWQKNQNENQNEIENQNECQNELPVISSLRLITQNLDLMTKRRIFDIHRSINHIIDIEIPRVRVVDENSTLFYNNIESRISFLQKKISENDFKDTLFLKENKLERKKNLYLLLEMSTSTVISLFHEWIRKVDKETTDLFFSKIDSLIEYINTQFENHSKRFNTTRFILNTNFQFS